MVYTHGMKTVLIFIYLFLMLIGSVDTQEACCLVMRRVKIRQYNSYSVFYQWKQWEISTCIAEKAEKT